MGDNTSSAWNQLPKSTCQSVYSLQNLICICIVGPDWLNSAFLLYFLILPILRFVLNYGLKLYWWDVNYFTFSVLNVLGFHSSFLTSGALRRAISVGFIYLFGVLRHLQHCTGHISTGSLEGRGNQYIQLVKVLYCKLPTNSKQLPAFSLELGPGTEPRSQRWEAKCEHKLLLTCCISSV